MIPTGPFDIIYADPPWLYADTTCEGKISYATMTPEELRDLPVAAMSSPNAILFMWVTYPKLPQGLDLIKAWGFEYKSIAFQWVKTRGSTIFLGLGRWTRGNTEPCLLAVRGKPHRAAQSGPPASVSQLVFQDETICAPMTRHSAKPPEVRDRIVQLMGDRPRIELFARDRAPGWVSWGNELPEKALDTGGEDQR